MIKLLEKDGKTYYNSEYVEKMIERAFQHGFYRGMPITLHFFVTDELLEQSINNIQNTINEKLFSEIMIDNRGSK